MNLNSLSPNQSPRTDAAMGCDLDGHDNILGGDQFAQQPTFPPKPWGFETLWVWV